jgi:hypothetical protein
VLSLQSTDGLNLNTPTPFTRANCSARQQVSNGQPLLQPSATCQRDTFGSVSSIESWKESAKAGITNPTTQYINTITNLFIKSSFILLFIHQ